MTIRYVGPGGNNANSGLSWALRKLTLNGVEDTPVVAGDTVYVGPGTYRETLTVDVSGTAGNAISYIGDYTGANTDGVGGVVRITGSDNDQTATRTNCITASSKNYRTFRGFAVQHSGHWNIVAANCTYFTIDQCMLGEAASAFGGVYFSGASQSNNTVSNCAYLVGRFVDAIYFDHSSTVDNAASTVSNCILIVGVSSQGIRIGKIGGITVKNCLFTGGDNGLQVVSALTVGQTVTVNNCIFFGCGTALRATTLGEITENYNNLYRNGTDRVNVATGANSLAYTPSFDTRWFFEMVNGGALVTPFDLASYSQLLNVAGTSPTTTDMRGTAVQGTQREWGALEYDSTLKIAGGSGGAVSISPFRGNLG